jgi:TPR repeat protein
MYKRGNGVAENAAQAFAWYRKAAPNDAAATYELSRMYGIGLGTPLDLRASVSQLREAARRGHQLATLELAGRLETGGNGIDRNYTESATWYRNAAEQGSSMAMLKLADYAGRGRGMTKDEALALDWYRKAGDAGSGEGAWQAAQAYLKGRGTTKDDAQALVWLRKAAALNHADASAELRKLTPP